MVVSSTAATCYHVAVRRAFLVMLPFIAALTACASSAEKQWYKPGGDYTVQDFQRDRTACEKSGQLDEDCLRQRGWLPLSADKEQPPPPPTSPRGSSTGGVRY